VKTRLYFMTLLTALIAFSVSGCSNHDGNEWERLVCEVESVNGGAPLFAAYAEIKNDNAFLTVDWVPVVFRARPYSASVYMPEDGTYSWFHVTSYDLTWHTVLPETIDTTVDGTFGTYSVGELLGRNNIVGGLCDARIPVNDNGVVSVLIADRVLKDQPWFRDYLTTTIDVGGVQTLVSTGNSFTANCELTFYGHESGSSREVTIPAGFMVTFYGLVEEE
jgi:hypothetical protein